MERGGKKRSNFFPNVPFFQLDFPATMVTENNVKLIVYDIELEQVSQWKN
jgi:hypothetical protein